MLLRVHASIFEKKNTNLSLNVEIWFVRFVRRQKHEYGHTKLHQYNIKGQQVILSKIHDFLKN